MPATRSGMPCRHVRRLALSLTGPFAMAESPHYKGTALAHYVQVMSWKKALWMAVAALLALVALFDVSFDFQFSLPGERRQPDPAQEARYAACYAERDREIHAHAFGTIDNPDVQKLYISNNREIANAECRERFPEQWRVVNEPFRFNLIDLRYRF